MLAIPASSQITAAVAALITAILSFLADFFPGVEQWFNGHTARWQATLFLIMSLVIGVLMFIAGNTTVLTSATPADIASALLGLALNILAAFGAGQLQKKANDPVAAQTQSGQG